MERPSPSRPAIESRYAFAWDDVEPPRSAAAPDDLGLSADDRRALGLAAPRPAELAPLPGGDAAAALREVLAQGAAFGKTDRPRRR